MNSGEDTKLVTNLARILDLILRHKVQRFRYPSTLRCRNNFEVPFGSVTSDIEAGCTRL